MHAGWLAWLPIVATKEFDNPTCQEPLGSILTSFCWYNNLVSKACCSFSTANSSSWLKSFSFISSLIELHKNTNYYGVSGRTLLLSSSDCKLRLLFILALAVLMVGRVGAEEDKVGCWSSSERSELASVSCVVFSSAVVVSSSPDSPSRSCSKF